jgi:hypothetical protein
MGGVQSAVALVLPGVTALMMGLDGRWSAIRITLELYMVGRRAGSSPSGRSSMIMTSSSP